MSQDQARPIVKQGGKATDNNDSRVAAEVILLFI